MLPPDLPAISSRAATGIRRSSPCAAAAFFVLASQVITKPGVGRGRPAPFLPLQNSHQAGTEGTVSQSKECWKVRLLHTHLVGR